VSAVKSMRSLVASTVWIALACAGQVALAADPEPEQADAPQADTGGDQPGTPDAAAESAARHAPGRALRRNSGSGIDQRVRLLTTELKLDAKQQVKVRSVLISQREQVAKVWSDSSLPAAIRVKATQSIGDSTADRIRGLLSEDQRKLYIQPRREDLATKRERPDVEAWMSGSKSQ
jgi:hypothetical protein